MRAPLLAVRPLFGLAMALAAGVAAAAPSEVQLWPESPAAGVAFRVLVRGEWPAGCVPRAGDSWIDGREIVLKLDPPAGECGKGPAQPAEIYSAALGESDLKAEQEGVYRLRVLGGEPEVTLAFALAQVGATAQRLRPESGLWWPERAGEFANSGPGFGAQVETQGELVAVTATGYNDSGRATWWLGASRLEGSLNRMPLSHLKGGSGPFSAYRRPDEAEPVGDLHVEWLTSARAVFWFVGPDGEHGGVRVNPVSMVRFSFGTRPGEAWRGSWLWVERGGDRPPSSQVLDWQDYRALDDGFVLAGRDRKATGPELHCRRQADLPDSPPAQCLWLNGQGKSVEFFDIGLNRMRTIEPDGREIELIRLD